MSTMSTATLQSCICLLSNFAISGNKQIVAAMKHNIYHLIEHEKKNYFKRGFFDCRLHIEPVALVLRRSTDEHGSNANARKETRQAQERGTHRVCGKTMV